MHHTSIKVYLSGVRSFHFEEGHPDPLADCLQLQRVLRGIQRCQGTNQVKRCPITGELMHIIHRSLDLSNYNHIMLRTVCCMGFFGFLQVGEFTVNSAFDPNHHLTSQDLQVDSMVNPTSIKVHVKSSKTDPFWQGCDIYISKRRPTLCPIAAIIRYLKLRGPSKGPLFINLDGNTLTCQVLSIHTSSSRRSRTILGPQLLDWGGNYSGRAMGPG